MNAADIIDRVGGPKAMQELTGLTKGRISQWKTENHIPRPWLKFLQTAKPEVFKAGTRRSRAVASAAG